MTFKQKLKEFKDYLASSIYISPAERKLFDQIPDTFYRNIFINNFNSDIELAKKILFKEYNDIDRTPLEAQTKKIKNYAKAVKAIKHYLMLKNQLFSLPTLIMMVVYHKQLSWNLNVYFQKKQSILILFTPNKSMAIKIVDLQ